MAVYTPAEIYAFWTGQGGSTGQGPLMVAVALAESGGDSTAVNSNDVPPSYGMWQEGQGHWGQPGLVMDADNWYEPSVQAYDAIQISGNGSNFAQWSTAWAPGVTPNYNGYLPAPQPSSPADDQLTYVYSQLGVTAPPSPGTGTAGSGSAPPPPNGGASPGVYLIPSDLSTAWQLVADWINSGAADVLQFYQSLTQWTAANVAP